MGEGCCGSNSGPTILPSGDRLIPVIILDVNNPVIPIYKSIMIPYFSNMLDTFEIFHSHLGFEANKVTLYGRELEADMTVADSGIQSGDLLECE